MKLPRVRLTVRRLMALILGLGLMLHFGIAAWQVEHARKRHVHTAIIDGNPIPSWTMDLQREPFWPLYWHRTLRLPMAPSRECFKGPPLVAEACSLEHPEADAHPEANVYESFTTPAQTEAMAKLMEFHGRDATAHLNFKLRHEINLPAPYHLPPTSP